MNTVEVPATDIRTGDKIEFSHKVWSVIFVALVRGTMIEITVKEVGLQARMSPEQKLLVTKNAPVKKVI
jgi:hypothetical protein